MVSLEVFALVLTGLSITASIVYYSSVLANANKTQQTQLETRQAQFYMQLFNKITSVESIKQIGIIRSAEWSTYEEWLDVYQKNDDYRNAFSWFLTTMEGFGVFIREGLIDIRLIALFIAGPSRELWEAHKEIIYRERERRNMPRYGSEWEYSKNELMKYMEKHPELAT